jgi:NADPH:quinone reductase-like Zn-dependent oxidoreductase
VEVTNVATGGKGVDLIVDTVGQAHFSRNLEALAMDGRMTMLSLISGSLISHIVYVELCETDLHGLRSRSSTKFGSSSNPGKAPLYPGLYSTLAVSRLQGRGFQEVSDTLLTIFDRMQHSYCT